MGKLRLLLRECRGYVENFIVPAIAVVLPWSLTISFYRYIAMIPWLYRSATNARFAGAKQLNLASDAEEKRWKRKAKMGQMIDLADIFLLLTRGDGFVKKYISDSFSEHLSEQQVIFTPHYGAGVLVYRLLQRKNIAVAMLINHPKGRYRVQDLCARFRLWGLRRAGVLVFDPGDIMAVRKALKAGHSLLIMPDMPVLEGVESYRVATEYGDLNLTSRFFQLAETRKMPVVTVVFDVDVNTGLRYFSGAQQRELSALEYAQTFAEQLVLALKQRPYLWHMLVVGPQVMLKKNRTATD